MLLSCYFQYSLQIYLTIKEIFSIGINQILSEFPLSRQIKIGNDWGLGPNPYLIFKYFHNNQTFLKYKISFKIIKKI